MAFGLKPKEEKFFLLLVDLAQLTHKAATLMAEAYAGEANMEEAMRKIDMMEVEADEIVAQTSALLMKTFIAPMDREDIQLLVQQMDDAIDSIKDIMDKTVLYHAKNPTPGTVRLAAICNKSLNHVAKSISYMSSLKKNHMKVEARAKKVIELEAEGDMLYHQEMARLFTEESDAIEIIKWKEILDSMEDVIDDCEKLVGTFRRVVLKYA